MSEIQCVELPAATALEFWDELRPYVEAALEFDLTRSTTVEQVQHQLGEGFARVLVCADGSAIMSATIIQCYVNNREERLLHVIATAGKDMWSWLDVLIEKLAELAEEEECAAVEMIGRPGWHRKLNKYGFKTEIVSMRLDINGWIEQKQTAIDAAQPVKLVR